jgi:hypothetical protein
VTPDLIHIPLLPGGLDLADEILQNWITQAQSDLTMEGVTTIEEWVPVPADSEVPFRAYPSAQLPAVWVQVTAAPPEWIACQTMGMNYTVRWGVVVSDGRAKHNRRRHEQVREELVALFGGFEIQGSTAFLNRSNASVHFDDISLGEVQIGKANPYLLWSVNTMRCRVAMPNPRME